MSLSRSILFFQEKLIDDIVRYKHGKKRRNMVKSYGSVDGVLTQSEIREAEQFWKPYIKHIDPLFHAWYKKCTGEFHPEIIPTDVWFSNVDYYFNNRKAGKQFDHKCLYDLYFTGANQPATIAKRMNRIWFSAEGKIIDLPEIASAISNKGSAFLKIASGSCGGKGVYHIPGNEAEKMMQQLDATIDNDIIVQESVCQCDELNKINSASVNTLRVLSLVHQGGVKIYSVVLRMGIGDAKVDNASNGGIHCGVMSDGRLKSVAYNLKGESFHVHPTSGVKFDDVIVPNYDKMIEKTEMLALQFPLFRMISWDWSIDNKGNPVLIEANLYNGGLDFHQLNNGPVFGEDTKMIMDEVFGLR